MRHFLLSYGNTIADVFAVDDKRGLAEAVYDIARQSDFTVSHGLAATMAHDAWCDIGAEIDRHGCLIKLAEITAAEAADIAAHSLTFVC